MAYHNATFSNLITGHDDSDIEVEVEFTSERHSDDSGQWVEVDYVTVTGGTDDKGSALSADDVDSMIVKAGKWEALRERCQEYLDD